MSPQHLDPTTTQRALTEHSYYRYRGCAPDSDVPSRAAGDLDLGVDAWQGPDLDGGEEQEARLAREAAAKTVCGRCPVLAECRAFGASVVVDGDVVKLAEQFSILGGMTALERTRVFVKKRHEVAVPAPDRMLRTPQKMAVLRALAAYSDPYEVAAAAGMSLGRANWQRARIATLLNLPVGASREAMVAEARRRGLLDDVPASKPVAPVAGPAGGGVPYEPVRVPSPRRDRFTAVAGQLPMFDELDLVLDDPAPTALVSALPVRTARLEAAA